MINDGAQVAHINPSTAIRASDVIVSRILQEALFEVLAAWNGPQRKLSLTRAMAGWSGFVTFTRLRDLKVIGITDLFACIHVDEHAHSGPRKFGAAPTSTGGQG